MAKEMEEQAEQEKVTVLDEAQVTAARTSIQLVYTGLCVPNRLTLTTSAQVTAGRISIYEAKYKELCQVMEGLGLEPLHGAQ